MEDAEFRALFKKLIESCSLPPQQAEAVLRRILRTLAARENTQEKEEYPSWIRP